MGLLRTIGGRVRSFRDVKGAVNHHGKRVARKLDGRFNPLLPESLRIDFWKLIQAIFEILKHSCDHLIGAEHTLVSERGNDANALIQRDQDAKTLSDLILGFRDTVRSIYQPPNIEKYGFPSVLGRIPFDLLRQGEHLLAVLGAEGFSFPEPLYTDGVDLPKELEKIRLAVEALRVSLDEAEGEVKLAQAAKVDKDNAEEDWDLLFGWGGRMLTGLFIWAGEQELANYMLPSTHRPGRTRRVAQQERLAESGGSHGDDVPDEADPGGQESEDSGTGAQETGDSTSGGTQPGGAPPEGTDPESEPEDDSASG